MKTNPNDPKYPVSEPTRCLENGRDDMSSCVLAGGLTKREYFAAMVLQGVWANPHPLPVMEGMETKTILEKIAAVSVRQADLLIAELNKAGDQ